MLAELTSTWKFIVIDSVCINSSIDSFGKFSCPVKKETALIDVVEDPTDIGNVNRERTAFSEMVNGWRKKNERKKIKKRIIQLPICPKL